MRALLTLCAREVRSFGFGLAVRRRTYRLVIWVHWGVRGSSRGACVSEARWGAGLGVLGWATRSFCLADDG